VAPRTPTESRIAAIWGEALGIPSPGIHDNFFDVGGHSLKAAEIVTKLRSALKAAHRHDGCSVIQVDVPPHGVAEQYRALWSATAADD